MSDFRARLFDEHSELGNRIEKLEKFILSDKYEELNAVDKTDMKEQLGHMKSYMSVLNRRVSRQCG